MIRFSRGEGLPKALVNTSLRWMFLSALAALFLSWLILKIALDDGFFENKIWIHGFSIGTSVLVVASSFFLCKRIIQSRSALLEELRKVKEQFQALVDISAQIVWFSEADGTLEDASATWQAFTGQTYNERKGRGWLNVVHPDDRERAWEVWSHSVETLLPYSVEYRVKHVSGEWRWMWARGKPVFNKEGLSRGWVGINSDIHDEKQMQIALQEAKNQAERSNQLKSAFLANMSHEIRTPLGAILGFSELLNRRNLDQETMSRYITIIRNNSELLETIISDILDLSKVEAGQLAIEYTATQIKSVLRDVFEMLQSKATGKGLNFQYEVEADVPGRLVTDSMRLKQILINIVGNALKFTSEGEVFVHCRRWEDMGGLKGVIFTVRDTGIGIDPIHTQSVFEVFVQADNSTTRKFGGTGLGLSLSRKLARQLGGDVVIRDSNLGVGTTFEIFIADRHELSRAFPLLSLSNSKEGEDEVIRVRQGLRILVVDDAADNQNLLRLILAEIEADVVCVDNGLLACDRLRNHSFDLVLMDLQMPVMDGYTATEVLRKEGFLLPIIAVSAHAMSDVRDQCIKVGFTDYLPKPINVSKLHSLIARHTSA